MKFEKRSHTADERASQLFG